MSTIRPTTAHGSRQVNFKNPPVTETILDVQFAPLRELTLPRLGIYWSRIREQYPTEEVKPPLPATIEDFSGLVVLKNPEIEILPEPDARFWFTDPTSTQLIQIQRGRFIRNWRKGPAPHDIYPRYDQLRAYFERDWSTFVAFLEDEHLGIPEVIQTEVSYVNQIELGVGWESLGDVGKVLTLLRPYEPRVFLSDPPELTVLSAAYVLPERQGRLHVAAQPAIRRSDGRQILQLTLTARGKPRSSKPEDIVACFDLGHDWIVNGFVDLTTPTMHEIWGKL